MNEPSATEPTAPTPPPEAAPAPAPVEAAESMPSTAALGALLALLSASIVMFELLLVRIFALVMIIHLANLALAVALLGIGFGATAFHLFPRLVPREKLASRIGTIAVLQGLALALGVLVTLNVQLTKQWDDSAANIGQWNARWMELMNEDTLVAILPVLMLPFFFGGVGFSAIFKLARDRIGKLYAADLWGGAAGGAIFIPLLGMLAGPDTVFAAVLLCAVAALLGYSAARHKAGMAVALVLIVACGAAVAVSASGHELLRMRYTAGYPEKNVTYREWTPVARLSVHKVPRRDRQSIAPDTSSGSGIGRSKARIAQLARAAARGIAFKIVPNQAPVAIIAASAGNDVAVAQYYGFEDITAIDIAGRIFGIVREQYRHLPFNPYLQKGVRELDADGRAGIMHSSRKYGVIQMRWANLNNAAGVISNAWSPSLLETRQAFLGYLQHLRPDGVISFSKGGDTYKLVRSAAAALRKFGVRKPHRAIALISGSEGKTLLIKPHAFSREERVQLRDALKALNGRFIMDPGRNAEPQLVKKGRPLTDNRPYRDTPDDLWGGLGRIFGFKGGGIMVRLNMMLWIQALALLAAGVLFVGLPLVWRGRRDLVGLHGRAAALTYAAAIGYAYLAIETVLIHDLILFVGHPTYAITLVILVMLLGSGLGSTRASGLPVDRLVPRLRMARVAAMVLALLQAQVLPALYGRYLLGIPLAWRLVIVGVSLLPLGYFMGMPFPLALRILPPSGGEIVPWMWAVNGWMSVVATMATVFVSRQAGFAAAFYVAIAFYGVAWLVVGRLSHVGIRSAASPVPSDVATAGVAGTGTA